MESGSWTRVSSSSSSRRLQSRSDLYSSGGVDEIDGDDYSRVEYMCPFCAEDFDIVGLCCHIDEDHPVEAKNGLCPVCAKRVGMDMVGHITTHHGNLFKVPRKRRLRKGGTNSTFTTILRKELRDGNLQSLFGGSSGKFSSSNTEADPLLSSFISNPTLAVEPTSVQSHHSFDQSSTIRSTDNISLERNVRQPILSDEDQKEKARKCEFIQGLLLSSLFHDVL